MRSFYFIILLIAIFTGCADKQKNITKSEIGKNIPAKTKIEDIKRYKQEIIKDESTTNLETDDDSYKIAIIFPSKIIGKYAQDAINTMMAYMLHNNIKFQFEVFDSLSQDSDDLVEVFNEINENDISNVIALFTKDSLNDLFMIQGVDKLNLYLPLVNKNEILNSPQNIVYGGIDYKAQIQTLLTLSNKKNSIFYANNQLGFKLKKHIEESNQPIKVSTKIDKNSNVFKKIVKNSALQNSSLFLNTSIIKSSIILSQLRAHETIPYKILSTQLNYTPLVISLTQYLDRKNFIIANSIGKTDLKLQESLSLLNSDIEYNWVNYSTLIGMDFLFNKNESKLFPSKIKDNQVAYDIWLYKNTRHGFKKLK